MMKGARLVGVYGKPWSQIAREPVHLSPAVLHRLGAAIVECIVVEAKKDRAREGRQQRGDPEGIPNSDRFFESFDYRIVGKSTVEITCSWPYIEQIVHGRDAAPMTKLTLARGGDVVPIKTGPGTVVFRVVPPKLSEAWVHPGFAKHNFIKRGVAAGRTEMMRTIISEAASALSNGDPLR